MKSLVKIIISLGIKIAIVALFIAIAIGFSSCNGCAGSNSSFSTANINESGASSDPSGESGVTESIMSPDPSSLSSQTNDSECTQNSVVTETTGNNTVAKPTEQTIQGTRNTESAGNSQEENSSNSSPTQTQDSATPTPTPKSTEVSGQSATPTPVPTATPIPTATPKPTSTPTPTNTPVPTATPIPEPTEAPKPAVAAYVQATFIVYGATDDDNPTYVESTVVRTYKVQPKDGCSYHSPHVSNYVCIDAQISWSDLDNAFLKEHPGCVVHGYDTVDEQVVGFVDD